MYSNNTKEKLGMFPYDKQSGENVCVLSRGERGGDFSRILLTQAEHLLRSLIPREKRCVHTPVRDGRKGSIFPRNTTYGDLELKKRNGNGRQRQLLSRAAERVR